MLQSKPTIGEACMRSSPLPLGMSPVWGISKRIISPSSAAAHQCAVVAPTLPAPMMVIFARRMNCVSEFSGIFVSEVVSIGLAWLRCKRMIGGYIVLLLGFGDVLGRRGELVCWILANPATLAKKRNDARTELTTSRRRSVVCSTIT